MSYAACLRHQHTCFRVDVNRQFTQKFNIGMNEFTLSRTNPICTGLFITLDFVQNYINHDPSCTSSLSVNQHVYIYIPLKLHPRLVPSTKQLKKRCTQRSSTKQHFTFNKSLSTKERVWGVTPLKCVHKATQSKHLQTTLTEIRILKEGKRIYFFSKQHLQAKPKMMQPTWASQTQKDAANTGHNTDQT